MGQRQDGSTVNATVTMNATTGLTTYQFNDPFSMTVNMGSITGVVVNGSPNNDKILLQTSSFNTIVAELGNDIFVTGKNEVDLEGNVLKGGAGVNIVQISAAGTDVDLTGVSQGTMASTGIEAVVGSKKLTGQSVDISLANVQSSSLTDGGVGPGQAFVALIGRDGAVNFSTPAALQLVGVVNAAGAGFAADGTALDPSATAALAAQVTGIGDVEGSLATLYAGSSTLTAQHAVANALNAYVFSNGTKSYTIWTDGTINQTTTGGAALPPAFQPAVSTAVNPQLGVIPLFDPTNAASATLTTTAAGATGLKLGSGPANATGAIVLKGQVSGTVVHGDNGANGGDYFGLAGSGGGNTIYGTLAGDLFELGASAGLIDILHGQGGFNVVHAAADGADVDLTSNNASTGVASTGIQAVVGSDKGAVQTVELNLTNLTTTLDSTGAKTSVFEALLGSSADTLGLSGGKWQEIAAINPGDALPTHATALTNADELDTLFNGHATSGLAETTLVGHLYELTGAKGVVLRYATVWTDAAISTSFTPITGQMAQAMAQMAEPAAASSALSLQPAVGGAPSVLAAAHA